MRSQDMGAFLEKGNSLGSVADLGSELLGSGADKRCLYIGARSIRPQINLRSDLVKIPAKRATAFGKSDLTKSSFVLQRREYWSALNIACQINVAH
jgi:hypothetical protein